MGIYRLSAGRPLFACPVPATDCYLRTLRRRGDVSGPIENAEQKQHEQNRSAASRTVHAAMFAQTNNEDDDR